jgi:hypothetical protein
MSRALLCVALVGCAPSAIDAGLDATVTPDAGASSPDASEPDAPQDAFVPRFDAPRTSALRVVTFNTGTTLSLEHDATPDDGYGATHARIAEEHYGNGLAWSRAIADTRSYLARLDPDLVVFQEIFHPPECEAVPEEARAGFVCETWRPGDPTVAQMVLGPDYQIACNLGKPDKCAAVHRRIGTFRGCEMDLCLDGLAGARVPDCGSGSRIGRGVIDRVDGAVLTLVHVHGSSGLAPSDMVCRTAQLRQVFEDFGLGDGPAANGTANVILGDFNTDPDRLVALDPSAEYLAGVLAADTFRLLTDWPDSHPRTYADVADIDHVITDAFSGSCFAAGITPGSEPPTEMVLFDHRPIVCDLAAF